jgi:LPS-assembly protein
MELNHWCLTLSTVLVLQRVADPRSFWFHTPAFPMRSLIGGGRVTAWHPVALLISCAGRMRNALATLLLLLTGFIVPAFGQSQDLVFDTTTPEGSVELDVASGLLVGTNGVMISYSNVVLVADSMSVNEESGEVAALGHVRLQSDDIVWTGAQLNYNFKTRAVGAQNFRGGKAPMYVGGEGLSGNYTNRTYTATNGTITMDDYAKPLLKVRAKRLVVRPGKSVTASGATLYVGEVPVFYLPVYALSLKANSPAISLRPGYNSRYGGYLYSAYNVNWGDALDLRLNADYRSERGFGGGPELQLDLGRWGKGEVSYYYLYDHEPETNSFGVDFPKERQLLEFTWLASPFTNTTVKSRVSYQTDSGVRAEFFESDYRQNVQPSTFVEGRHFWDDWSLNAIASPRVNDFFSTVERLPEVKLTAFRQQVGPLPVYYESESRAGYLRRLFAETNTVTAPNYEATRADTWHQVVLPVTLFGWLNVTPNAGGRFTYYSEADGPGATTEEIYRSVFNTGAEMSFKASRTWAGVGGGLFDLDGLRHIIQPSASYVYVPDPDAQPGELPQFDFDGPSLRLLPNDFPDRNSIDSIDSENVLRVGLENRLQTKREGQVQDWLNWEVFTDWRIDPEPGLEDFSDLWNDFKLSPRSWLTLQSQVRYDLDDGDVRLAFSSVTLRPNNTWNWRVGHLYLQDDFSAAPTAWGEGDDVVSSTFYFKLNENWGLRASHYINLQAGELQEQSYSLYHDFRSWTGALSFRAQERANGETDYTVAFVFTIKGLPLYDLGEDTIDYNAFLDY